MRKALEVQAENTGNIIEETLVGIYEENSKTIQDKLQEIFAVLDRICKSKITRNFFFIQTDFVIIFYISANLERELNEFKQALGLFYQDVQPLHQMQNH